jgi:hypothetical protein
VEDSERFCTSCGAYIGEPAVKVDNWEAANNIVEKEAVEEHTEAALENDDYESKDNINDNFSEPVFFISSNDLVTKFLGTTDIKNTVSLTAVVIFLVSLLLTLLARFSFTVPNDLIDIILPVNLLSSDIKSMLNLPGSLGRGFMTYCLASSFVVVVLFTTQYFFTRLILKIEVNIRKLWMSVMLSCSVYGFFLALYFAAGFINKTVANTIMLGGIITSLLSFYSASEVLAVCEKNKVILLTASSLTVSYIALYIYIYLFLR